MNNKNNFSRRETAIQQGRIGSRSFAASYFAQLMLVGGNCEKQFLNTNNGEIDETII